ncbi:MAG TPA: flagellar filament capping protein FliD [Burkholderiaceae bacterium]|nr:flagellar filament capping protein FliD [Burkholderiaceae bacterium]
MSISGTSSTSSTSSSGSIDVSGIVSQLMQVESQPLTQLQQKESNTQAVLTAYGQVQSAVSSLQTAINTLRQSSAFTVGKATVAGNGTSAVAGTGAASGRYAVSVSQLARAQSTASAAVATADTSIGSGSLTITSADGSTVLASVSLGGASGPGTLNQAVDEINAANTSVRASLVSDGGQVRLVLTSTQTGSANGFQVTADPGLTGLSFTTTQTAQDASYSVNGLPLTSSSNTITDAIPGVTLSLTQQPPAGSPPGTTVDSEISVDLDTNAVASNVQAFVTAYNSLETTIDNLTKYDPSSQTAAVLNGESTTRQLQGQVRSIVTGAMTNVAGNGYTYLSQIGISFQADGTLSLDSSKLSAALTSNPGQVTQLFTNVAASGARGTDNGFAVQLSQQLSAILAPDGLLDAREQGLQTSISQMNDQVTAMQSQLALTQQRLTAQYSALDALLSTRQQQMAQLTSALAGLQVKTG